MTWSLPIGTVKGTVIRVHLTFLLFLVWIGVTNNARGGQAAAVEGIAFTGLLFVCVLLHEFGATASKRRTSPCCPSAAWPGWNGCRRSRPRNWSWRSPARR